MFGSPWNHESQHWFEGKSQGMRSVFAGQQLCFQFNFPTQIHWINKANPRRWTRIPRIMINPRKFTKNPMGLSSLPPSKDLAILGVEAALVKHGPCSEHRSSFEPIKAFFGSGDVKQNKNDGRFGRFLQLMGKKGWLAYFQTSQQYQRLLSATLGIQQAQILDEDRDRNGHRKCSQWAARIWGFIPQESGPWQEKRIA